MSDIWERRNQIDRARSNKMHELMEEYDKTVYYPAKKQLYKDCYAEGHVAGKFHNNGFGWTWFYCSKCGGTMNQEGPNGETTPDCGAGK
jgi:hypothetical protein